MIPSTQKVEAGRVKGEREIHVFTETRGGEREREGKRENK